MSGLAEARDELAELLEEIEHHGFDVNDPPPIFPITGAGWVYLVRAISTPLVKVGYTGGESPRGRLVDLQTASPHELVLLDAFCGTQSDERELHDRLARRRVRGEWFTLSDDDVSMIARDGWRGYASGLCQICQTVTWAEELIEAGDCCYSCQLKYWRDHETTTAEGVAT